MKKHSLLFTLLLALMVPMAAVAQVERTVTVYNGKDTECHVPLYGNVTRMDDLSYSQFIMDKSVLQAAGLAGKEISKMTLHLANSVPDSYEWTTKRRTIVTLAEVDASELDGGFIQNMTNPTNVFADYLDAHGETMEIIFGTPFTYSGEQNLLVQFREEYMYYFNYHPFASYRLPMYYGVYKTGASYWRQVRASNNYSTVSSLNCHFVPKTTFTYLTEANWANTKAPKNAITQSGYSTGNNNSISYYIRMDWDASDNYTGSYQVLCVPRGTSSLNWSTAATTNETFYSFGGLEKNTAYDLYVRAKSGLFFTSNVATASSTTPFYPANLDDGPLTFDFNSQTMPNGLDFDCSTPRYLSAYGSLNYCNLGTTYNGATAYNNTPPITITLPELKFTNATNGLMLDFDLKGKGVSVYDLNTAELQVKIIDRSDNQVVFSQTVSASNQQHFTFRLPELTTSNYHLYTLSFSYAGGTGFGLDNIVVRKAPNIMPPYNLAASEITPTSAEISWTDDNTNSHTFDLVYRQKGYSNDPNVWEHYVEGVTNPYTLTGLTPYTDYEVKVKTITSSAYEDSEILEFSTLCTPAEVPYIENLNNNTQPTDWRFIKGEGTVEEFGNGRLTIRNTAIEVTQNFYGYPYTYTSYSGFWAYIILPYFENLASLQLSFKAGRTAGSCHQFEVGVMSDPFTVSTFCVLDAGILNVPPTTYNFNLAGAACQHGHIVIRLNNYEENLQSVWFDDFSVQQYAAPTDLTVLTTNNSATLGWNAGAATEWEVRYKATTSSSWGSSFTVTEPTYTITGLTENTEYEAQVRAKYGDGLYSTWEDGDFGTFKTLMQAPVVMPSAIVFYEEGFESDNGNWMFIDGGGEVNRWRRFSVFNFDYGNLGYGLRVTYSTDNSATTQWKYRTGYSYSFGNNSGFMATPATSYAVKTFTLSAGHYEFGYDYAVKGRANDDYMRVVLVPAETVFEAGVLPEGFDYNNTPNDWFALDGGQQLVGNANNSNYYGWNAQSPISLDVYPGGPYEPGNYMIVVLWKNDGSLRTDQAQNPPGAIDNVSVTWSSLVYPPAVAALHPQVTDTEAPLAMYAPEQGIAPTSYEVQYEPAAAVNTYEGAPIATFNVAETPQTVTLTGLTPLTLYSARVRSVYTANGHSVYSDWQDCPSLFTTLCTPPTNLVVVGQTSSWANVRWNPVEMTLPDGQYINYCVQLTTDLNDWGDDDCGWASDSWEKNLAPGTYHFRVRTAVYEEEGNLYMGGSDWSEPITFTIVPWTDPVTIFPLAYGFEEPLYRFADGITISGDFDRFGFYNYYNQQDQLPAHADGESQHLLAYHSSSNSEACLVLPPMSSSDASADLLVSFWWYHFDSETNSNVGVTIEYSFDDGATWQSAGDKITRFADETGWVKYQQVVPTESNPTYVRLRFEGAPNSQQWWNRCYLDDLKVYAFKSEQPYIHDVFCDASTADITLYDYAFENGYHSSDFQVQYREYRNPGEPEEEWITCPVIENEAPYSFINHLMVTGLQPTTLYEFRACARVSYSTFDFPWSNYCEPYRQWTSCGTYTITPEHSYTIDFEDEFYYNCWTGDIDETGWHVTTEESHGGTNSFCIDYNTTGNTQKELITPPIDLTHLYASTDNVILRFWVNYTSQSNQANLVRSSKVKVYNGSSTVYTLCNMPLNTNGWIPIELSLSKQMGNVVTVGFQTAAKSHVVWYIDDIEIIANPYPGVKILDIGGYDYSSQWNYNDHWYPTGAPTASDDVMVLEGNPTLPDASYNAQVKSIVIGQGGAISSPSVASSLTVLEGVEVNCLRTNPNGNPTSAISIGANTTFSAGSVTLLTASPLSVNGTANIGTLNPSEANSVVVKNGGVLNATIINGTTSGDNDKIRIESGGQVKTENAFYGIIEKNITGYGTANADTPTGWNLIASPALVTAVQTFVPQIGSEYQFDQMDIYQFTGGNELEWDNFKCPFEGGCDSPFGTIPQGQFSAELGQPLKGYLYALQEDATIQFAAGPVSNVPFSATNVDADVNLTYYTNPDDASLNGWNLIGNPYTCNAYLKQDGNYIPFYKMNDTGDAIVGVPAGTPIKPCEAVFVCCTEPSSTVTITTTEPAGLGENPEYRMVLLPTHTLYEDQDAGTMMEIELVAGWNWFAPTIEMSLEALQSKLDSDAVIQLKEGNTSSIVAPGRMIKIYVDEEEGFSLMGRIVAASITIEDDINWIGYTGTTAAISTALTTAFGTSFVPNIGDKIISQDNGFAIYNGTSWEGTLTSLVQGKGYIYVRPLTE